MTKGSLIKSVMATQVSSDRGHPGVETVVTTENGATGITVVTAGVSVGIHEVQFAYDGGTRWKGKGVMKAVNNVNDIIATAIIGKDATKQGEIDNTILELDGTENKANLGGNATGSVSAAVLKAGAASLGVPLYQHIGGVNANILPTPGVLAFGGSLRYGGSSGSGGKPSYELVAYGFNTFSEASYACWNTKSTLIAMMAQKYGISGSIFDGIQVPPGIVDNDRELWALMTEAINASGYEGKFGLQVDVAAATYYDKEKDAFVGIFSRGDKTKDDMIKLYKEMVNKCNFIIIEDPLDEEDYEGHALLTRELGIQIVGDDLFTTNVDRLKKGIEVGACNTVLLKVNQIGSISEAFDTVQLAYSNGYGMMPCSSRGEGADISDYAVGLGTGTIRESGVGPSANRFLQIEAELGDRAKFLGKAGFKIGPARVTNHSI
jgi:enolase